MAFAPVFRPAFPATFDRRAAAASWWFVAGKTTVAAYQPISAASLAASYTNLANPGTNNAAPGTAPTWDATGWAFDGTTQYLTTGVVPASTYSMIVRFSDGSGTSWREVAGSSGSNSTRFRLAPIAVADTTKRSYSYGATTPVGGARAYSGVMALTPGQGYYNGSPDHTAFSVTWTGTPVEIFLGTYNANGAPSQARWNGKIQAVVIYSAALTAGEVATVSAGMAAL